MNKRWLLSRDGQEFIQLVAGQLQRTRAEREAIAGTRSSTGDPETDWELVKDDYIKGLELAYGQVDPAVEHAFRERLDAHYERRFHDGYATIPDFSLLLAQALVLGGLTANMYKLHKGDVGQYPVPDTTATLSVYYLEWARDYVGFYELGYVRWSHEEPQGLRKIKADARIGVEFEKGCILC